MWVSQVFEVIVVVVIVGEFALLLMVPMETVTKTEQDVTVISSQELVEVELDFPFFEVDLSSLFSSPLSPEGGGGLSTTVSGAGQSPNFIHKNCMHGKDISGNPGSQRTTGNGGGGRLRSGFSTSGNPSDGQSMFQYMMPPPRPPQSLQPTITGTIVGFPLTVVEIQVLVLHEGLVLLSVEKLSPAEDMVLVGEAVVAGTPPSIIIGQPLEL